MAKLFSKSTPEALIQEPVQPSPAAEKGELKFVDGKFLGSYFFFGTDPIKDSGRKLLAPVVSRVHKFSTLANAEEVLGLSLPEGFVKDATSNGWTLVECINHAHDVCEGLKTKKKVAPKAADFDLKTLMKVMVEIRPNTTPRELLDELKAIVEAKGEAAVEHLDEILKGENPRDKNGYVYLRKVKAR